ncbi:MAG: NeuD/PglB/VioB family sugar acetyltransferase [Oryzihumus sp.]
MPDRATHAPGRWLVLGASGHARSLVDVIQRAGGEVAAVVGRPDKPWVLPVIERDEDGLALAAAEGCSVALGIGSNVVRARLARTCLERGLRLPPLVAATATVATSATLGPGTAVLEHAHIGPNSVVGTATLVNTAAVVEHDCQVAESVHLGPRATLLGGVQVGDGCLIGSAATVLPFVRVAAGATVGAGAVVPQDVAAGATVVGIPARQFRSNVTEDK